MAGRVINLKVVCFHRDLFICLFFILNCKENPNRSVVSKSIIVLL